MPRLQIPWRHSPGVLSNLRSVIDADRGMTNPSCGKKFIGAAPDCSKKRIRAKLSLRCRIYKQARKARKVQWVYYGQIKQHPLTFVRSQLKIRWVLPSYLARFSSSCVLTSEKIKNWCMCVRFPDGFASLTYSILDDIVSQRRQRSDTTCGIAALADRKQAVNRQRK